MFSEEIVQEIDKTLDQLIRNAEAIATVELKELSESELEGFQKTQESLLQHLIHMDQTLVTKIKTSRPQSKGLQLQQKLLKFETMKSRYTKSIESHLASRPIVCKRKAKRFFDLRSRKPIQFAKI